jgi:CRISPR-associated DxTHG motif protein
MTPFHIREKIVNLRKRIFNKIGFRKNDKFSEILSRLERLEKLVEKEESSQKPVRKKIDILYSEVETDFRDIEFEEKQVIVSFLGKTGYSKNGFKDQKAEYSFSINNEKRVFGEYQNMYPLIADRFSEDSKIVLIGTEDSIKHQEQIGKYYRVPRNSFKNIEKIEDESNYDEVFWTINKLISRELESGKDIIVDLTHGFRHLPILTVVSLVTQNLIHKSLKHIFFAKEITFAKEYEIIDLRNYIDLANINYTLQNFKSSYSLLETPKVAKKEYRELLKDIHEFSKLMVGNLFGELLKPNSISEQLLEKVQGLLKSEDKTFNSVLKDIENHLKQILEIANSNDRYEQFYKLSKIFKERKFYLNSSILLNEAVGQYFGRYVKNLNISEVKQIVAEKESNEKFDYELTQSCKGIFQQINDPDFSQMFLNRGKQITEKIRERIKTNINEKNRARIVVFINDLKTLRNSISHGNLGSTSINIDEELERLVKEFDEMVDTSLFLKRRFKEDKPTQTNIVKKVEKQKYLKLEEKLNYKKTLEKLEELKVENSSLRIPNITELNYLFENKIIETGNYWSSTEVYRDETKVYVLKKGNVSENSKQATNLSIFVSDIFEPIEDTIREEKFSEAVEREKQSEGLSSKLEKLKLGSNLD